MDIHFCDLCGARVTEIDLQGGHGIRRHYDVICATCVELGHGKEWLANSKERQEKRQLVGAGVPNAAAAVTAAANAAIADAADDDGDPIAVARDRVATLEEDRPDASVQPQVVDAESAVADEAAIEENDDAAVVEDEQKPAPTDIVSKHTVDDDEDEPSEADVGELIAESTPSRTPALGNQLSSAASSFSAMGTSRAKEGDNGKQPAATRSVAEESAAVPIIAEGDSNSPFAADAKAEAMMEIADVEIEKSGQKDETLPAAGREPLTVDKKSSPAEKKSSGSNNRKGAPQSGSFNRSSGKNNVARNGNGKSSKTAGKTSARKRAQDKNKNIVIMSMISVGILLMLTLIIVSSGSSSSSSSAGGPERIEVNLSANLKNAIGTAKNATRASLATKNVAEMKAARQKIWDIIPEINAFESEAKKNGYTDDEVHRTLERAGWNDVNSLIRNLNDEIIKQGGSR